MENELFSILEDDAQDRNTHRACLRAVARAQKQFGSFFKQAASEEDFMARLDLVHERINDVVREACIEEGSASLDTVARVLAGELARTSEVMRDTVKEEDIAPSDGEDDEMHVRGVAGRKLLGLDDQEGESKTAAPRRKPVPKMDEGTGRMYQPKKNPPRAPKVRPDHNTPTTEDPMRSKNVVVEDGQVGKPKNQQQLDWDKKNKNKVRKEPEGEATNKSLSELEKSAISQRNPWDIIRDMNTTLRAYEQQMMDAGMEPIDPLDAEDESYDEGAMEDPNPQDRESPGLEDQGMGLGDYGSSVKTADDVHYKPLYPAPGERHSDQPRCQKHGYTYCPECFPEQREPGQREEEPRFYGKTAVETGDTYTQETVDLPKADANGLSEDPSPKMDKGTAGDENHTSQKPIEIPSVQLNPEVQDVTDPADYTATLEVPGVLKSVNPDTPMQPEHNVAPGSETFPNKDQANPITSKWKVLG